MSMTYHTQLICEEEGARAAIKEGKKREDCPYDKAINPGAWNHWVYGCETAAGELETLKSGFVSFCSTSSPDPIFTIPVDEARRTGQWNPRWLRLMEESSG